MNTKSRTLAAVVSGLALCTGLTAGATAAAAASGERQAPSAASAELASGPGGGCQFWARKFPYQSGKSVRTHAYSKGCHQWYDFTVTLQRSRWFGWEDMAQHQWHGDASRRPTFRCDYRGTHEWRSLSRWHDRWGEYDSGSRASQTRTFTCS